MTLNRRRFLEQTAGIAAGSVALGATGSPLAATTMAASVQPSVTSIGLQLYTVRDLTATNIDQALEGVAQVGYKVVEFAGYGNRTPEQIRATLDRLKLTAPSTHISLQLMRTDFDNQAHIAEVVGHKYITIPSLGADMPLTADGWKKMADEFNTMAAKLKPRKIGLGFHSHRDEFMAVGAGKKGMDIFIAGTDPTLVVFEIDLGWARVAGENPIDWFNRYSGRIKMWHVKDIVALKAAQDGQVQTFKDLAARAMNPTPVATPAPAPTAAPAAAPTPAITGGPVPVGAGEIDYKPIFAQWKVSGLEHFFVEQDSGPTWPGGSLVAIATSYRNLVNLLT